MVRRNNRGKGSGGVGGAYVRTGGFELGEVGNRVILDFVFSQPANNSIRNMVSSRR